MLLKTTRSNLDYKILNKVFGNLHSIKLFLLFVEVVLNGQMFS